MTSNHTQSKQFSGTDFVCRDVACNVSKPCHFDCRDVACNVSMAANPYFGDVARYVSTGDSPRFAVLPQYIEYKRTKPFNSRTCNLADDFQWIPALQREWNVGELVEWRRQPMFMPCVNFTRRRISKLPQSSIPLSLRKGILLSQPSFVFHRLLTPFLSQPIAKHDVCMMEPNRYLRLMLAAKAGGLPQAGSCSFNSKYLLLIN